MTFQYEDAGTKTLSDFTRRELADRIKADVNAFCVKEFTDEHRNHIGASIIDHECSRFIWYVFRWVKFQFFDGRMLRLFNRGHLEEARFIQFLRGIGCQVWEVDPHTNKQFRIYGVQGHYGGSMDAGGITPYFPDLPMLMEFKTHNYKSFSHLLNKGSVALAKPMHYGQMCNYGKEYKFQYGLYCAVNKNDDDLYFEIVKLDWNHAHTLTNKAQDIVYAKTPPARISDQPSYFECKYCGFKDICHHGEAVEVNCRSCKQAVPADNGEWFCSRFNNIIPADFIKKGCEYHVSVND